LFLVAIDVGNALHIMTVLQRVIAAADMVGDAKSKQSNAYEGDTQRRNDVRTLADLAKAFTAA